jgi:murein DD-endopeptidase MepM/ murein hydrolase activator NlpD
LTRKKEIIINSPYMGDFKVTQTKHANHDGLDLVGIDSKEIHSTVNGIVERAGWENEKDHNQGFGQYVRIKKDNTEDRYYFGHMSKVKVKVGQRVKITDVIGIEGSTGKSTGSHCHYCVRGHASKAEIKDVCVISGIPNKLGIYNDGYVGEYKGADKPSQQKTIAQAAPEKKSGVTSLLPGSWNVRKTPSLGGEVARVVRGPQSVTYVDIVPEANPEKYGARDFYELRDGTYLSVKACK